MRITRQRVLWEALALLWTLERISYARRIALVKHPLDNAYADRRRLNSCPRSRTPRFADFLDWKMETIVKLFARSKCLNSVSLERSPFEVRRIFINQYGTH